MTGFQKWIPLTGVLFVILTVVGFGLISGPDNTDQDQKLLDWYNDSGHQTQVLFGAYVLAVASVAMLLFMNRMRWVVSVAEGEHPVFGPFVLAGGAAFVAAFAVGTAAIAAVPAEMKLGDAAQVTNADVVRFLPSIGYGSMLVLGMFPLIFAMFAVAVASMRHGIFPGWFNWLTIVCGIILFFAAEFVPLLALLVWMLVASWQLMQRQDAMAATIVRTTVVVQ